MRGQWWIPVIAIVLGTGLAVAIDRLPGGGGKDDVQLSQLARTTTTGDVSPTLEETTTTLDEETTTVPLDFPEADAPSSGGGATRTPATRSRSTTGTTRRSGGGGGGTTGTTAGTTATTRPARPSSSHVNTPSPGPTSSTVSSDVSSAAATIVASAEGSTRKFWPMPRVGRRSSARSAARTRLGAM